MMTELSTAFVSNLCSTEIISVIDLILKRGCKNSNETFVFIVSQNRILMYPSPLSSNFARTIVDSNPEISTFNEDIQGTFKAQRKILLIKRGRKTVFPKKTEVIAMVESKVRRKILSKQIELRRIESASLIQLLENVKSGSTNRSRSEVHEYDTSHVTNVEGRAVKAEKSIQETFIVWSAPGGNESYENPSHPSTDKYPTQVTDMDVDCPSMEVTPSARYRFTAQGSSVPSASYSFSPTSASSRSNAFSMSYSSSEASAASSPSPHSSHQSDLGLPLNCSPKYVQYTTLASRLDTFHSSKWLVNEKPSINTFANQGMFYTGREDLVRCFVCGIGLKDWIKTDDVMEEHRKYSSACPFLLQKLTSTEVDSSRQAGNQTSYRVRSPQYQTMNARLETFERFPSNVDIPHQQLAVAGLFYTGEGDLCRCFTCDGGLKDWSTGDDPCKEHATYFPKCNYIIQLKGAAYVRDMQHRRGSNVPPTGAGGGSAMQTSTATTAATTTTGATTLSMPSMDRLNISGSLNRTSTEIQLREMGYSESDVEHAKAELRRKGDSNPSVELIVNTILDMQDRTNVAQERTNAAQERTNAPERTNATQERTNAPERTNATQDRTNAPERTNATQDRTNATTEAQNEHEDIQEIAAEHERLSRIVQCMLCVKEEPAVLFLPCAHHRLCHNCSDKVSRCPVCETVVKEKVRTYRA